METKTEVLDAVELELAPSATVAELHDALQARMGWGAPDRLQRCAPTPAGSQSGNSAATDALCLLRQQHIVKDQAYGCILSRQLQCQPGGRIHVC